MGAWWRQQQRRTSKKTTPQWKWARMFLACFALLFVLLNLRLAHQISLIEHKGSRLDDAIRIQHHADSSNNPSESNTDQAKDVWTVARTVQATAQLPQTRNSPTTSCSNYNGVLHIAMGDIGGAAGTIFFQFVLGQLIYAETNNLIPWIHFDNVSNVIYEDAVHGVGDGWNLTFRGVGEAVDVVRPNGHWRDRVPGAPRFFNTSVSAQYHFAGTGVWGHYFEPVIPSFDPGDPSCQQLPYVTLTLKQITPGIHGFAPWAPRCWRYHYLPDYVTKPHIPIYEWLRPSRLVGHLAVQRYGLRFRAELIQAAHTANPHCVSPREQRYCLALHIRHSDKAAGRRVVHVAEFLPYVTAFVRAGGRHIYLATDSTLVLQEIAQTWPESIQRRIRSLGDKDGGSGSNVVVRSNDEQAVFDIGSHHRTNTEVLIEILALSMCRFMVHGLSAVSESTLWLNRPLQSASVDLEDSDHIDPSLFGTLVQMVLRGEEDITQNSHENDPKILPKPPASSKWWRVRPPSFSFDRLVPSASETANDRGVCSGYNGILRISSTGGDQISVGTSFFTHVLNQLLYAEKYQLIPWVHLEPSNKKTSVLYDRWAHSMENSVKLQFKAQAAIVLDGAIPGAPQLSSLGNVDISLQLDGNGLWETYFEPVVADFDPRDPSCAQLPLASMSDPVVMALTNQAPWTMKAWKYESLPTELWKPDNVSWKDWYNPIRSRAHNTVHKYYRVRPYLADRVAAVNPVQPHEVCLSVHLRNGDKKGKSRSKIPGKDFLPYIEAFVKAGGSHVYVASDSHRTMQFVHKNFPKNNATATIRSQGDQVVRTTKEWPLHMIDSHHRVNGEALVDVLAMSKCHFLLHTFSTMAEASIYFNLDLHQNSINLEDPGRISAFEFAEQVARLTQERGQLKPKNEKPIFAFHSAPVKEQTFEGAKILFTDTQRSCRTNAVVYLAQKKHSSYAGRDSYTNLIRSLELVNQNYISIDKHVDNLDLFLFHTNDFNKQDLEELERRLGPAVRGVLRFVDLNGSPFWQRPNHNAKDDPNSWYAYPLFSEGYRRMMHWFAIDIWDFFSKYNEHYGCSYRYIFRLDEDSYIHSPIRYDIFDFMNTHQYVYGYRLCAYEMQVTRRMWTMFTKRNPTFQPKRDMHLEMCGFYNNLFVADLEFFQSQPVQKFLRFIDRQGHIYRRRLGDLMIHSMSVYGFAEPSRIHRFLDFTYEHGTANHTSGCLVWGGIQAGYADENAAATLSQFYQQHLLNRSNYCMANATFMRPEDLSPSYSHIPEHLRDSLLLHTITAGRVEFPLGKGVLSG